jgi:hypothetical protein
MARIRNGCLIGMRYHLMQRKKFSSKAWHVSLGRDYKTRFLHVEINERMAIIVDGVVERIGNEGTMSCFNVQDMFHSVI